MPRNGWKCLSPCRIIWCNMKPQTQIKLLILLGQSAVHLVDQVSTVQMRNEQELGCAGRAGTKILIPAMEGSAPVNGYHASENVVQAALLRVEQAPQQNREEDHEGKPEEEGVEGRDQG
jgi:hypothetical protein